MTLRHVLRVEPATVVTDLDRHRTVVLAQPYADGPRICVPGRVTQSLLDNPEHRMLGRRIK